MTNLRPIFTLLLFSCFLQAETPAAEATRLNNEGARLYAGQHFAEAERLYRAALALETRDDLRAAIIAGNLGTLYKRLDRYADAERSYKQALELRRRALPPNQPELAYSFNNLADIYRIQGRYWEARNLTLAAVHSLEQADPKDPEMPILLSNLGVIERYLHNPAEAEQRLQDALMLAERLEGPDSKVAALALNNLAQILEDVQEYDEAEVLYTRAVPILEKLGPVHTQDLAIALSNFGRMQSRVGRFEEAKQSEERALALIDGCAPSSNLVRAQILHNMGNIAAAEGRPADALTHFEKALMLDQKLLGDAHPSVADILWDYSAAALKAGNKSLSTKLAKRAERIWTRQNRSNPERFAVDVNALRDPR